MFRTQPQTVSPLRVRSKISQARRRWSFRFLEEGLYRQMAKSPSAAQVSRFSMTAQGVSRSDREMTQKSWPRGAPSTAPPERAAVTPATTSTSTSGYSPASSSTGLAMP